MKERFWSLILVFIFFGISQNVISKSINIQKVWLTKDNNGYTVHSKFDISGMKGKKIHVIATFYDSNKKVMKMVRQEYRNTNNGVAVSSFATPLYEKTTYNDYQLFIPSDALMLTYGLNTCYVNISVRILIHVVFYNVLDISQVRIPGCLQIQYPAVLVTYL